MNRYRHFANEFLEVIPEPTPEQVERAKHMAAAIENALVETVLKWSLEPQEALLKKQFPKGSKIIHVGPDPYGNLCVWTVGPEFMAGGDAEWHTFQVVGTGWKFPALSNRKHVGSALCGSFVWHVFEIVDE